MVKLQNILKLKKYKIALIGNPNAGKTTLFNSLTGANNKVGNWHGVTTFAQSAEFKIDNNYYSIVDLPGIYSLCGSLAEEKVAEDFLKSKNYDIIVVVIDAKRLLKSIKLIEQLKQFNKPIVAFINLYVDFLRKGGKIDLKKAKQSLGVEIIVGEAVGGQGVSILKQKLLNGIGLPIKSKCENNFFSPQRFNYKLSSFLFGKHTAVPVFLIITVFISWFSFGRFSPVNLLSGAISRLFDENVTPFFKSVVGKLCSPFITGLTCDGVLSGISSVLVFLPQVCAMALGIDFLDQSGYLSGFSAVADDILGKFGLSGKALYTLFGGFGCTAIALSSADGIDDKGVKMRTVLSLPFISCSAKTPVYLYFASAIFKVNSFLVILSVWILSVVLSLIHSFLLKNTIIKSKTKNFIAEIADLRIPNFKTLLKSLQKTAIQFIIKLAGIVLILSSTLWILKNVSTDFKFLNGEGIEYSLLALIGKPLRFLFYPIGITDWRFSVAMLSGVFAKEGVASTLAVLFVEGVNLTFGQGLALTFFCYAYTPCVTALCMIKQKIGLKFTVICAVYQLIVGLFACYGIYYLTVLFL